MVIKKIIKKKSWPHLEELINFLLESWNDDEISESLKIGINQSIIFYSAYYLEGILESGLKAILYQRRQVYNQVGIPDLYTRKTVNTLFNALEQDIEERISRTTGVPNYDILFELLTDQRISDNANVKPLWEGVQTLFQFRNVLAHGREISATMLSAYWIEEEWKELFSGGYKKAEDYIFKNKLINKRFVECDSISLYLNDNVADHFWQLSKKFVYQISKSLAEDVKEAFDSEVFISNDNGNA